MPCRVDSWAMPNGAHQRTRATDFQYVMGASSRGSLHPPCSADFGVNGYSHSCSQTSQTPERVRANLESICTPRRQARFIAKIELPLVCRIPHPPAAFGQTFDQRTQGVEDRILTPRSTSGLQIKAMPPPHPTG